jgi:LytR_cpsA_psr family
VSDPDEAERTRRRRTSRHLLLSLLAVAVFACAIVVLYVMRGDDRPSPQPTPQPPPTSPAAPLQPTLLIQATTSQGAVGNVLTALRRTDKPQATSISLPPDLVVSSSGAEPESIRRTVASLDTLRAPTAVAATLGIRVDAAWRMDRKALAGLIDSVGGVQVQVLEAMRIRDENDEVILRLRPGTQMLSGTPASWYAVGQVPGQADTEAEARFSDVMTQTLAALPDDELAVRESLTALGALAPSTIGTQELSAYLVAYANAIREAPVVAFDLPTTPIVIGDLTWRWVDYREATPRLRGTLPLAQWRTGIDGPPRALVLAPAGHPGWIGSTRVALEGAGMLFVDGRGTPTGTRKHSRVEVRGETPWGPLAADALQLPTDSVHETFAQLPIAVGEPWADVDITLGLDYVPE